MDEVKMGTTKVSVNGNIAPGGHLLLYSSSCANIQTHLSLDTLHYTQFHSGIIPNSMDLIWTPAVKGKQKDSSKDTNKKKKKNKKGGRLCYHHKANRIICAFATASLLSFYSNKEEKICLTSSKHFTRTH